MGGCLLVFMVMFAFGWVGIAFESGVVPGIIATVTVLIVGGGVVWMAHDALVKQAAQQEARGKHVAEGEAKGKHAKEGK